MADYLMTTKLSRLRSFKVELCGLKSADTGANIHEQDYIQSPYHHYIYCRHRNGGPHLCEDIRLYPDGNLNASVCLLASFLSYVSLKKLIIDGANGWPKKTPNRSNYVFLIS
jgi:hypothetical protein